MAYNTNPRLSLPIYYGTEPVLLKLARENRKRMTLAERILWDHLRGKKFMGIKFRRQHPISQFIADFYCHQAKLIIELDGGYHDDPEQNELDVGRENVLKDMEIKVIRFRNEEIEKDVLGVLEKIALVIRELTPP
jgi:very-short-patch-repair endonuclease